MDKLNNIKRDKLLASRLCAGDKAALSEFMDLYYDAIYFTILKMVNNKSDAEDLTLEVFQKVFFNIKSYSPEYAFSTWLFKIASNTCIDFLRKKKASFISIDDPKDEISENVTPLPHHDPGPDDLLINKQAAIHIRTLVEQLKPFWQRLIEMRYYSELSYEEIASQLQVPMGTIKNQLYRAKEQLAKLYDKSKQ